FPSYFGSAERAVLSHPGGARGGVTAALAALPRRYYVDRPAVLLQFRAGAVHGGSGRGYQERRDAEARTARPRVVPLVRGADVPEWGGDHRETRRWVVELVGSVDDHDFHGRAVRNRHAAQRLGRHLAESEDRDRVRQGGGLGWAGQCR